MATAIRTSRDFAIAGNISEGKARCLSGATRLLLLPFTQRLSGSGREETPISACRSVTELGSATRKPMD
jgi:hypothetical protein